MNSKNSLHLLALLIFIITGSTVSNLYAQGRDEDYSSRRRLQWEVLHLAIKCRYAPLTKVSFPITTKKRVQMALTEEQYVFSYIPLEEEKTFYIQALLYEKDNTARFFDATFLGPKEFAEKFYKGNYEYFEDTVALEPGMRAPGFTCGGNKWLIILPLFQTSR